MRQTITRIFGSGANGTGRSRMLLWAMGVSLSLLVGTSLYMAAARNVDADARQLFDNVARSAQYSLSARVKSYTDVVRALVALFRTSDSALTRLQFHRYVEALDVPRNFPAIEALTYVHEVGNDERAAFIESVRQDRSVDPAGYPDFTISPPGRRPSYSVITFIEPMDAFGEKFGVDIGATAVVRRVLDLARDTGKLAASGRPIVVNTPVPHIALGMRLPVYRGGARPAPVRGAPRMQARSASVSAWPVWCRARSKKWRCARCI